MKNKKVPLSYELGKNAEKIKKAYKIIISIFGVGVISSYFLLKIYRRLFKYEWSY